MLHDKLNQYLDSLSQCDTMDLLKKQAMSLHKAYRAMVKASNAEFNHTGDRGGRSNAANATLYSRSHNTARIYDSLLEDFKIIFKRL